MTEQFPTLSKDNELLLSDGQTNIADGFGKVGGVDKFLPVVPGRAYIATVDVTSIDTTDTNEVYRLMIYEASDLTPTPVQRHQFTANGAITAAGIYELGFVASQPFCALGIEAGGTTPSIVIAEARVAGVKN